MATISAGIGPGTAAPAARQAPDRPGPHLPRYRRRHAATLSLVKRILILAAILLALLVGIWPEMQARFGAISPVLPETDLAVAGRQAATNPSLSGIDGRGRRFLVTARAIAQTDDAGTKFRLDRPEAGVSLAGGGRATLTAPTGMYGRAEGKLYLSGGVDLASDGGYEIRAGDAVIDFTAGTAASDSTVEGKGAIGSITAGGFRILGSGATLVFSGPVELVLHPRAGPAGDAR